MGQKDYRESGVVFVMKFLFGFAPQSGAESWESTEFQSRRGALSTHTKKTGDGFWCPECFGHEKFEWCSYDKCYACGTSLSDMDKNKIKLIMRSH